MKRSGYNISTPGVLIKELSTSMVSLQKLLTDPRNKDIYEAANRGRNIEESLGHIAAALQIPLDGYYDVDMLVGLLVKHINNRSARYGG